MLFLKLLRTTFCKASPILPILIGIALAFALAFTTTNGNEEGDGDEENDNKVKLVGHTDYIVTRTRIYDSEADITYVVSDVEEKLHVMPKGSLHDPDERKV